MKDFRNLDPMEYFRIPWRRHWYFLATAFLVIVGAWIYARLRPNLYRSETRILVESATLLDDPLSPSAIRDRTEERVNAIRQLLESRTILERVIEEFRLRASDTTIPMEDALKSIRNSLEISKTAGNTFTMAYHATDPQAAQAIMRRLAEILIQTNQTAQKNKAVDKDQFMEQELRQAELDLAAADEKIKQFKDNHLGELPEQNAANMNALNELHSQLVALDSARDQDQKKALEFRLQEQKRLSALVKTKVPKERPGTPEPKGKDAPTSLEAQLIAKRAMLAEMAGRYTVKHPDVVRLSKEIKDLEGQLGLENELKAGTGTSTALTPLGPTEAETVNDASGGQASTQVELNAEAEIAQTQYELDLLGKTIARREKERETILKSITVYQNRLNLAPSLEQELLTLTREHETKRLQVANLQTRKFNAQMAANAVADKKNDTYRILDDANLPELPTPPTELQIVLIGVAAGLGAGIAAAFGREYFEPSLASEDEVAHVLRLPVLISVPEIPARPKGFFKSGPEARKRRV
jgi:polysaccharide chain length determinant protein (PEP-CTERM system associated)